MKNDLSSYFPLSGWTIISPAHAGAPRRRPRTPLAVAIGPLPEVRKMHM